MSHYPAVVIDTRCVGCGLCLVTCPERALRAAPRRPDVIGSLCTGCLACLEVCPAGAIGTGHDSGGTVGHP